MSELFCAKVITELMPSVRSFVSNKLIQSGLSQEKTSSLLGVTQPAISQYKKKVRGALYKQMEANDKFSSYLCKISDDILSHNTDINAKTCEICRKAKASGLFENGKSSNYLCLSEIGS